MRPAIRTPPSAAGQRAVRPIRPPVPIPALRTYYPRNPPGKHHSLWKRNAIVPSPSSRPLLLCIPVLLTLSLLPESRGADGTAGGRKNHSLLRYPCCLSLWRKVRTARTVGKGRACMSLRTEFVDYDDILGADGSYHDMGDKQFERIQSKLMLKYGWAEDHQIALGIPYVRNDISTPNAQINNHGITNIFVFEKYSVCRETDHLPAMAVDAFFFLPTGDPDRKLGSDHAAGKITAEFTKTWPSFSLHVNPGYRARTGPDQTEVNVGLLCTRLKKFWFGIEYNYLSEESKGDSHDIVPGCFYKVCKGFGLKAGLAITLDSDRKYRDRVRPVFTLCGNF